MAVTTSLIIATYNWPQALDLCLNSVQKQTVKPDEIIIADDGSGPQTKEVIDRYSSLMPIKHIWHADTGFRLAAIRNKANAVATGEYLIQTDGDLILHPSFISDHVSAIKPRHFIGGSRVILSEELSRKVFLNKGEIPFLFTKGIRNKFNGIHNDFIARFLGRFVSTKKAYNIRGCNMGYWKKDFIYVNGYDESFKGWGREDTDLVIRFYNAGLKRTFFKLRGIGYHLWHKEAERKNLESNESLLADTISRKRIRCEAGVDQYISEPAV